MSEKQFISDNLKHFFEIINQEVESMEQCRANSTRAITLLSDDLRVAKVKTELDAPVSKLRPRGEYHEIVLYENRACECGKREYLTFMLPDGGTVTTTIFLRKDESYTEEDKTFRQFVFKEIFVRFSRSMMQGLLRGVLMTDMATGIPNQEAFMQFVGKQFATGQISSYTVLFFNIHNFKYINKIFTYEQGDIILRNYAGMVHALMLEDEILARLGGDNFVALVKNDRRDVFLSKIQNIRMHHQTATKEKNFIFGVTVGISDLHDIKTPGEVMARASIAYQAARMKGSGSVAVYTEQVHTDIMETQSIISSFLPALEAREFVAYFQPKVDIHTRKICGGEALVRWIHDGKVIAPMAFIPQLERDGSVCKLDYYMLEETCKFIRKRLDEGKCVSCISVNFSRKHLDEDDLVKKIVEVIDRYEIDHQYIEIELTESEDFQNYEIMSEIVNGLHREGIATSIDDFGTGYSSLNMIKKIDLNMIKIDKSFIPLETDYPGKEKDMIMFSSMIELVKKLGKKTIAEGVETKEQLQYLREVGCDIVQGYVYDKPMPADMFAERLEQGYESGEEG